MVSKSLKPFASRNLIISFLVWTIVALFTSTQLYLRAVSGGSDASWWGYLKIQLLVWWLWGIVTPGIFYLGQTFRIDRENLLKNLSIHLPVAIIIVLLYLLAYSAIWNFDQGTFTWESITGIFQALFLNLFHWHFFIYIAIIVVAHARIYFEEVREKDLRAANFEKELLVSRLKFLKMQMQPHFLFNTLNNIVSSIKQEKSSVAINMTTSLSDLLRMSLDSNERQISTLEQELKIVQTYLGIEMNRFEDLDVLYEIDEASLKEEFPSFILQTIVENAIKHGISKSSVANKITITTNLDDGWLEVAIVNEGPKFSRSSDGIGLSNVKERLKALYQGVATFSIAPHEIGTLATIRIPV